MHNEVFYTKKINKDITLAVISDIHYYPKFNTNIFRRLEKQVQKRQPNYICVVGDILDESKFTEIDNLITFFTDLAKISPVIVVLGNHDEKTGAMFKWQSKNNSVLTKALNKIDNLHLLEDEIWQDNNITFYGFNLSFNYYEKSDEAYEVFVEETKQLKCPLQKETYNITLFHSPANIYQFIAKNPNHPLNQTDLILSGHMHNGCLPFIIAHPLNKLFKTNVGLISPQKTLFPKLAQGKVTSEIKDGYIYEGVTKLSHSTKMFHAFDFIFQKKVEFLTIKPNNKE